jgi:LuxR family maltose regulon positive regulatory protein
VRQIQDYLVEEVLAGLPTAMQDWLTKTSILDRLCAPLCEAVCVREDEAGGSDFDGRTFVRSLAKNNLFRIALDERGEWCRYHHLFQGLLHARLTRHSSSQEIATLHSRASEWFESRRLIDESIRHALAAGNPDRAAEIVERHRHTEQDADRWRIVERWLSMLPPETRRQRPGLLLAQAWILHDRYELEGIPPIVEQLESLLFDEEKREVPWGELNFFQGVLLFWQGQGESSRRHFETAQERIPKTHPRMRGLVEIYLGLARQMVGQSEVALDTLTQERRSGDLLGGPLLSRLHLAEALIRTVSGESTRAAETAQLVESVSEQTGIEYMLGWGRYVQACSYFRSCEWEAAVGLFERVVDKRYVTHTRMAIDSMVGLALAYQALERPDAATEAAKQLLEFALETGDPGHLSVAHSAHARISLAQGDLDSVVRWVRSFNEAPSVPTMFIWLEVPSITQARVWVATGSETDLRKATGLLEILRPAAEALRNTCQTIEILVLQSVALKKQGRSDEAFEVLEQTLALAEPGGWFYPFVESGPPMADLLKRAMKQGTHGDYAREILATFGARASRPVTDAGQLVEPLTNREEEILELLDLRLRDKEIATRLCVSTETVKSHLRNLYQKLGVRNRREAVTKARSLGLLLRR